MIVTLENMLRDMKNGVYDYTDNGKCIGCGQCCSNYLPLSSKDIKRIKRYIQKKHIQEQKHTIPMKSECVDAICPFRDNGNKICTIYSVKPTICSSFKCDLPKKNIKGEFSGDFKLYDVRELFYGTENSNTCRTSNEEE